MAKTTRRRNPEASRAQILNAGTAEFSEKGFEGARIDNIVQRAGVSKNLVYHYFGGKDDLFLAVMEAMYEDMRAYQADLQIKGLPPVEGMERLVRHTFSHFVSRPEVISLLNSENLHRASHIRGSAKISGLYNKLRAVIVDLLERGQASGVFRKDVDPMQLYISIAGLGYFYLSNQYTLGAVFDVNLSEPKQLAERENHIVDVILGYLKT